MCFVAGICEVSVLGHIIGAWDSPSNTKDSHWVLWNLLQVTYMVWVMPCRLCLEKNLSASLLHGVLRRNRAVPNYPGLAWLPKSFLPGLISFPKKWMALKLSWDMNAWASPQGTEAAKAFSRKPQILYSRCYLQELCKHLLDPHLVQLGKLICSSRVHVRPIHKTFSMQFQNTMTVW